MVLKQQIRRLSGKGGGARKAREMSLTTVKVLIGHRRRGCDEHQECEIDLNTVGGAAKGDRGVEKGEMIDR